MSCRWTLSLVLVISVIATLCHAGRPAEAGRVAISGQVIDEQSLGVSGVKVRGVAVTDLTETTTDDDGRFVLNVLEERVRQLAVVADDAEGDRIGIYMANWSDPPSAKSFLKIPLVACRRLPVEVTDSKGEPAGGVQVGAVANFVSLMSVVTDAAGKAMLRLPADVEIRSLYAVKRGVGFDYRIVKTPRDAAHQAEWFEMGPVGFQLAGSQSVQIRLVDSQDKPIVGMDVYLWLLNKPGEPDNFNLASTPGIFHATTSEAGVVQFHGVPDWDVHPLTFWPLTEQYVRERIRFDPKEHPDGKLTVKLDRLVPVTGQVKFGDGRPAAGVSVSAAGVGYKMDRCSEETTTDEKGRFEMHVVPDLLYMFAVTDQRWAAPAIDGMVVQPDKPVDGLEFKLARPALVYGHVTVGSDKKPVAGQWMSLRQEGRDLHNLEGVDLPNPENSRRWVQPSVHRMAVTDEQGRFEFFVGPGKFTLAGPTQVKAKEFEVVNESEFEFNFVASRPETGRFIGRIVAGDPPRPVAGAIVEGKYRAAVARRDLRLRADDQGRILGERLLHPMALFAKSPDGDLAGIVEIGSDQRNVTITIGPLASAKARLIDAETGSPLPERIVQWCRRVHRGDEDAPWSMAWGGTVTTDPTGFFEVGGLVVGQEYWLCVHRGDGSYGELTSFTPDTASAADLGDLKLEPPYKPPTFQERVDRELNSDVPADKRYDVALKEAARLRQHVLVVFLERDTPLTESWFKLRLDEDSVRLALHNYQVLQVDVKSEGAAALAKRLAVPIDAEIRPTWWFGDALGKELDSGSIPRLTEDDGIDQAVLVERLTRHAPGPLDARQLLKEALAEATKDNRRVIVQETATWCGPCHRLAHYLERHRPIWEKDYVWVRIDFRWKNRDEVMKQIREGRRSIPWYAILDADGKVLATSDGPSGNIGYPANNPEGINHFMTMIQSTMQRLNKTELAALRKGLESK